MSDNKIIQTGGKIIVRTYQDKELNEDERIIFEQGYRKGLQDAPVADKVQKYNTMLLIIVSIITHLIIAARYLM